MENKFSLLGLFESYEKSRQEFPLLEIFKQFTNAECSGSMKYTMTSSELIRHWSFGEVKRSEIIYLRTGNPVEDGLFCSKIFGPIKDYECLCGKYRGLMQRGFICETCGVEVNLSNLRGQRMAHIDLVVPCSNIWFTRILPSFLSLVLDMSLQDIELVLYFEAYVVTDPGMTPLKKFTILSEADFDDMFAQYGHKFKAKMGAEGIKDLLQSLDFEYEIKRSSNLTGSELMIRKNTKRLMAFEVLKKSNIKPEWMILDALPVIAPDLRPLGPFSDGHFAVSDFNEQYRRVITINNRIKTLIEKKAPACIMHGQKLQLQEAVDCLLDNGRSRKTMIGVKNSPLRSLVDIA